VLCCLSVFFFIQEVFYLRNTKQYILLIYLQHTTYYFIQLSYTTNITITLLSGRYLHYITILTCTLLSIRYDTYSSYNTTHYIFIDKIILSSVSTYLNFTLMRKVTNKFFNIIMELQVALHSAHKIEHCV